MMQWTAIIAQGEAGCALRDYINARNGLIPTELMFSGGGEAVVHYGGPRKVIENSIYWRKARKPLGLGG